LVRGVKEVMVPDIPRGREVQAVLAPGAPEGKVGDRGTDHFKEKRSKGEAIITISATR